MNVRFGDAYADYMATHTAAKMTTAQQPTGFWAAVGNILTTASANRGVVEVRKTKSNPAMNYAVLGIAALGAIYFASKA